MMLRIDIHCWEPCYDPSYHIISCVYMLGESLDTVCYQFKITLQEHNKSIALSYLIILTLGNRFQIRWFTPTNEVPLCGHATVASAAVLFYQLREY